MRLIEAFKVEMACLLVGYIIGVSVCCVTRSLDNYS